MLRGIVKFLARIVDVDKEVTFPLVEFNPNEPGVGKVEIEGPNGSEILNAVHLTAVVNSEDGIAVATKVHMATLDRISFFHGIAIENGHVTESEFSPKDPPTPGEFRITPGTDSRTALCSLTLTFGIIWNSGVRHQMAAVGLAV